MKARFQCSRCDATFAQAGELFSHLVCVEGWESDTAWTKCQQLIYPEEFFPDAEGVLRRHPQSKAKWSPSKELTHTV